jgi:hypothetical protein
MQSTLQKDDIFIHGDSDEIPSANVIRTFIESKMVKAVIVTNLYRYFYNLYFQDWKHMFINKASEMSKKTCLDTLRRHVVDNWPHLIGGWHFSPVGDFDFIMNKYQVSNQIGRAKGHPELIQRDRIKERINKRLHPFRDDKPQGVVHSIQNMPQFIIDNKERFKDLLL